jgi:hypothetical protein
LVWACTLVAGVCSKDLPACTTCVSSSVRPAAAGMSHPRRKLKLLPPD